jgi:hypothetical protein
VKAAEVHETRGDVDVRGRRFVSVLMREQILVMRHEARRKGRGRSTHRQARTDQDVSAKRQRRIRGPGATAHPRARRASRIARPLSVSGKADEANPTSSSAMATKMT